MRPRGPQGRSGRVRKTSLPPAFDPRTLHPIASGYTGYDVPAHIIQYEGWSESKNKQWIFPYSVPFSSWSPWNGSRMCQIVSLVNVCLQHVILWTGMLLQRAESHLVMIPRTAWHRHSCCSCLGDSVSNVSHRAPTSALWSSALIATYSKTLHSSSKKSGSGAVRKAQNPVLMVAIPMSLYLFIYNTSIFQSKTQR